MEQIGTATLNSNIETSKCCKGGNDFQKLRILALHGYRQNAAIFKAKTGSFRKTVHKWAQFSYLTAPHNVTIVSNPDDKDSVVEPDIGQSNNYEQYGWFFNRDDGTYRGIQKGGPAIGFEESLKLIESTFEEEGPFDGLLGFSQGACFVGLLCDLQQRGLTNIKFDFAILCAGFKSGCLPHLKYFQDRVARPSLHIFGETDAVIPTEMSEALSNCFQNPVIVKHPGGHYLAAGAAHKHAYKDFFKDRLKERTSGNA